VPRPAAGVRASLIAGARPDVRCCATCFRRYQLGRLIAPTASLRPCIFLRIATRITLEGATPMGPAADALVSELLTASRGEALRLSAWALLFVVARSLGRRRGRALADAIARAGGASASRARASRPAFPFPPQACRCVNAGRGASVPLLTTPTCKPARSSIAPRREGVGGRGLIRRSPPTA